MHNPFGIVSPFLLPAKLVLQELTRQNLDLDSPITSTDETRWQKWLKYLPELNNLTFLRCYKPLRFIATNIQLHCFADASNSGYSACCYFRFLDKETNIHVSFIHGIYRVLPKYAPSIPRLEFTAPAVAGTKLASTILKDIDYHIDSVHYWFDSTSVLQCINSTSTRFTTFVHQRLMKIRALSRVEKWHHIGSSSNPADIVPRVLMPNCYLKADIWFNGPDLLHQTEESYIPPGTLECDLNQTDFACEIISVVESTPAYNLCTIRCCIFHHFRSQSNQLLG